MEDTSAASQAAPSTAQTSNAQNRIALDAMGGDYAPAEVVLGAVQAAREQGIGILLVGPEGPIRAELAKHDTSGLDLDVVHTDEVIGMDEHPAEAVRAKPRNSITLSHQLVRDGRAIAAVSAGNSGAVMAAAIFTLRRIKGVDRPAFGGVVPAAGGKRPSCSTWAPTPIASHRICCSSPSWATPTCAASSAWRILASPCSLTAKRSPRAISSRKRPTDCSHRGPPLGLNFIGNVEGRDINAGDVDVVVCDGFVGNVVLKLSEGLARMLAGHDPQGADLEPRLARRRRPRQARLQPRPQAARL